MRHFNKNQLCITKVIKICELAQYIFIILHHYTEQKTRSIASNLKKLKMFLKISDVQYIYTSGEIVPSVVYGVTVSDLGSAEVLIYFPY